uniref:Uncharacterized protein n=1 Tax=Oscillatoriales cyanobacterium SpSt-402 TaxID=2282168 RepID=A0A832M1K6_9CYAN
MKRHQIRRMIPGNVSDAQLRRAIADLGLPADDDHSYSDEEARQILNQFRGQQESGKSNPYATGEERHSQSQQSAHQASVQDKASLSVRTKKQLASINASLEKIEADRENAIEQVSDKLAYLYSPQTFHAAVLNRTAEKLGLKATEPEPEAEIITLDSLGDCFSSFADSIEYPAIAPSSALGCLPM